MFGNMRSQNLFDTSRIPFTLTLIAVNVITYFLSTASAMVSGLQWLMFTNVEWLTRPWTLITWPFLSTIAIHPVWLFFSVFWAFWVCGSLERSWGTRNFLLFFLGATAITSLGVWCGGLALGKPAGLVGLSLGVAAPTLAWCVVNRRETIYLMGVLPCPAPLLAGLTVLSVWWEIGPPVMGLFGLTGCAAAFAYANFGVSPYRGYSESKGLFGSKGGKKQSSHLRLDIVDGPVTENRRSSRGPLAWWKAKQEQKKLQDLWNRSIAPDVDDREKGGH